MKAKLFRFLFSRYVRRTVRKVWNDTSFTPTELDTLLNQTWTDYQTEAMNLQPQANLGNWLVMHFAVLTLSAYHSLRERDIPKEAAIEMVYQVTWHITSTWTRRGNILLKLFYPNKLNRLYAGMQIIMHTAFSPPAYCFTTERFEGGFREDVAYCPVAAMMREKGVPELCSRAWCGVDPGVVAIMGGKLTRTGTLAMGAEGCDFVFHVGCK